jgi:ABC-type phosphate transport system substrate-binding protein
MRILVLLWAALFFALLALPGPSFAGADPPVVVITHKVVVTPPLGREELRTIFQTKRAAWSNGVPIRPFNLPDSSVGRRVFDLAVLSLDPARVARYWIDRQVRAGDRPPPTVPSSALMIRIIAKTVGSIGYVEGSAVHPGVKVVARIVEGQVVKP